jgi:hypothetical protein
VPLPHSVRRAAALFLLLCCLQYDALASESKKTTVVVLGVEHAAQLVAPASSAGMLTAFIERVAPEAICIERPPEQASRRDFYDFTYEVQDVVVPHADARRIALCPMDWMPSVEDQMLAFGRNLDEPPEMHPRQGLGAFVTFPDAKTRALDLFFAEDPAISAPVVAWSQKQAARADRDFPRRLYLYRTFLQARRVASAANHYRGRTLLVVVGYFHKPDIEAILSADPSIELRQAASFGRPADVDAEQATTQRHRAAVLSFNLLGRQAETRNVDWQWLERTLTALESSGRSAESQLFRARLEELTGPLTPRAAATRYRSLLAATPADAAFSWTGVKDASRLDSFFDPFGNLTVRQRITIELVRSLRASGGARDASRLLGELRNQLGERKGRQLDAYAGEYLQSKQADPQS